MVLGKETDWTKITDQVIWKLININCLISINNPMKCSRFRSMDPNANVYKINLL
jgi:hypothetical protein